MTASRTIRLALAALLAIAAPVALAPASWAARTPTASVTLTAPVSGTSTLVGGVTVAGKAAVPSGAALVLTVDGSVSGPAVAVAKSGTWSQYLYIGRVGVHELCAQVRSSQGAVLASSCVTWEMRPDPDQFSIWTPYDGAVTYDVVTTNGACQPGASVVLAVDDGDPVVEPCDPDGYGWSHLFTGVSVGDHTLTASLLGNDGSTVVATRSVTWTVAQRPLPDIEITSPEDGSSGVGRQVVFTGTVTNIREYIQVSVDGYQSSTLYLGPVGAQPQPFEETVGLPYGSHEVCLTVDYYDGTTDTDCVSYTVLVEPETFSVDSPQDGRTARGPEVYLGGRCTEGSSVDVVLDDGSTAGDLCDEFSSWGVLVPGVSDGPHTATVTNAFDGVEIATVTVGFTVDSTPPAVPVVLSPKSGATITTVPVEVSGTAEPGTTVLVSFPGTTYGYGSTYVNDNGTWSLTLERPWFDYGGLLTGRRASATATVTATDQFDRESAPTTVTWSTRVR